MYSQPSFCLFFPFPLPPSLPPLPACLPPPISLKQWFCQPVEKLVVSGRLNIITANSKLWRWSWPRMSYSWRKLQGGLDNMRTEESWWGHGNCVQVTLKFAKSNWSCWLPFVWREREKVSSDCTRFTHSLASHWAAFWGTGHLGTEIQGFHVSIVLGAKRRACLLFKES